MELKGSKTEKNLQEAFAGESQARNKYTYFASQAKKEGYEQIAAIFLETAENEKEHAKMWFKYLHDGAVPPTAENLKAAAEGENFEHTEMYKRMAQEAREEGFMEIAAIFLETAENEKEHAKMWFKYLHDGAVPSTAENLKAAAEGENFEHTEMYKRMAQEAREEGFMEIAAKFELVGKIEAEHEKRYLELLEKVKGGKVFIAPDVVVWKCRNCGHIHIGKEAPKICPACSHPQSYFELRVENY